MVKKEDLLAREVCRFCGEETTEFEDVPIPEHPAPSRLDEAYICRTCWNVIVWVMRQSTWGKPWPGDYPKWKYKRGS